MYEVLKTEKFAYFFSFMVALAAVGMLIPTCKGDSCIVKKAPSMEDMKKNTYRIGSKCYQFKPTTTDCPASGTIEAFVDSAPFNASPYVWTARDSISLIIVIVLALVCAFQQ
jgi:hypothetical protein